MRVIIKPWVEGEVHINRVSWTSDSSRKIHLEALRSNLSKSIDRSTRCVPRPQRCIYQALSRTYVQINSKSETPIEVNAAFARSIVREFQLFSIVSFSRIGSPGKPFDDAMCIVDTLASFNRSLDRIDSRMGSQMAEGKKIDRLYCTKILLTSQKWRHPLRC